MIGSEWEDNNKNQELWIDPISMDYQLKQWYEPKQSTKAFCNYFSQELETSRTIIDLGTGAGAATFFLANKFLKTQFGIYLSKSKIMSFKWLSITIRKDLIWLNLFWN